MDFIVVCDEWSMCSTIGDEDNFRLCFYQTRSAWSMDQGSTRKRSAVHNFARAVTKFCVMWEGLSLPHGTKFGNCRGEIVDNRMIFIWSLIHGSGWSCLIKAEPGQSCIFFCDMMVLLTIFLNLFDETKYIPFSSFLNTDIVHDDIIEWKHFPR